MTFKQLKDHIAAHGLYDILKYALISTISIIILFLFPHSSIIGTLLNRTVYFSFLQFGLIICITIICTITITYFARQDRITLLEEDLRTDPLTNLPNERAFEEDIQEAINWANKEKNVLSIILIDIDNFKDFNTNLGHPAADELLIKFGNLLKSDNRITDKIYRQHAKGDEFIIIAKDTTLDNAVKAANRKKDSISKIGLEIKNNNQLLYLKVSCGVTEFLKHTDDKNTLLGRASKALLQAKSIPGKNSTQSIY